MKYSVLVLVVSVLLMGCANMGMPDGGEKDIIPPVLLKSNPPIGSVYSKPRKIKLVFDENILLKNQQTNFSVTPDIQPAPKILARKNMVEVTLPKGALKDSTTYTLNFGNSIVDLHEENILRNFIFSFSTGAFIDSGSVSGIFTEIKTNNYVKNATVQLQAINSNRIYTATTNDSGKYHLYNLANGVYELLAFTDNNHNKKPDNKELYYRKPIQLSGKKLEVNGRLIAFYDTVSSNTKVLKAKYIDDNTISLKLNHCNFKDSKISFEIGSSSGKRSETAIATTTRDSFIIYHPFIEKDSLVINVLTDTLQQFVIMQPRNRKLQKIKISPELSTVRSNDPLYFKTSIPLKSINNDKILLNNNPLNSPINIENKMRFNFLNKEKTSFTIIFLSGAIIDINGKSNINDTFNIIIPEVEKTGNLEFTVKDPYITDSLPLIIKVYDAVNTYTLKSKASLPNKLTGLLPGKYSIEIFGDENNNGIWDGGDYYKGKEPEKIKVLKDYLLIKPNWDSVGVEILMD
jgi:uncharacterized protein (DUF2141 family)